MVLPAHDRTTPSSPTIGVSNVPGSSATGRVGRIPRNRRTQDATERLRPPARPNPPRNDRRGPMATVPLRLAPRKYPRENRALRTPEPHGEILGDGLDLAALDRTPSPRRDPGRMLAWCARNLRRRRDQSGVVRSNGRESGSASSRAPGGPPRPALHALRKGPQMARRPSREAGGPAIPLRGERGQPRLEIMGGLVAALRRTARNTSISDSFRAEARREA